MNTTPAFQLAKDYADSGIVPFSSYIDHESCNLEEFEDGISILEFSFSVPKSFTLEELSSAFSFYNHNGNFFSRGYYDVEESEGYYHVSAHIRSGYDI